MPDQQAKHEPTAEIEAARGLLERHGYAVLKMPPPPTAAACVARVGYEWPGPGPQPARWTAPDGTIVYRSYGDYIDD